VLTNYGYPLGYAVSRVKQRLNVGLISIAHGSDLHSSFNPKNKLRANRLRQLGYERSDQVVGVSRTMAERVREVIGEAPTPIEVVHNGIDLENWRREQEAARTGTAEVAREFQLAPGGFTLQVGALRTVKRPDVAIRAVARARDSYDRLNLTHVMVGEGKLGADYRTLAGELGISDRIVFAGNRTGTDKAWLFAHARFLVHTSDDEGGLPLVLSEAAASGLPLLVSDIPSHQDFVADSGCGRLFRKGDPDDLARGMRAMLEGDLGRMRAASLERSKNFSWNTTLDAYERLCKKVIGLVQPGKQAR
jgi:glycosyltransferase involved in cell wall biosynthesis